MVKKIPLTQGKYALVDDGLFPFLSRYKWYAHKQHSFRNRDVFYPCTKFLGKTVYMHQLILKPKKGMDCDHINGNGLDNRLNNLRVVTHRQNLQNNRQANKTSKYPGVHFDNKSKKWIAQMRLNKNKKYLGSFKSEKEAFNAYKDAVHQLTGEKLVCELEEEVIVNGD